MWVTQPKIKGGVRRIAVPRGDPGGATNFFIKGSPTIFMKNVIRPSRLWPKLLKYYLLGILFLLPFAYQKIQEFYPEILHTLIGPEKEEIIANMVIPRFDIIFKFSLHMFIIGILLIVVAEIKRFRIKYVFYDDRVVKIVGILITDIKDVSYDHIDYFHTHRSLMEKITRTATLKFKTPADKEAVTLEGVGSPEKWAEFVMKRAKILV